MRYIRLRSFKKACPFGFPAKSFIKTCPLRQVGLLPETKPVQEIKKPEITMEYYSQKFNDSIESLKKEGRYREFISIKRQAGQYPIALNLHNLQKSEKGQNITLWCSNDYLGAL